MPKQTLLSSLFGGLAQGANFAGQNLIPYRERQRQNVRQDVLDERATTLFDRGTEGYEHRLERRPIIEGREDEVFGRGTEQYTHELGRRPTIEQQADEAAAANLLRTSRQNVGTTKASSVSSLKDARETGIGRNLDLSLAGLFAASQADEGGGFFTDSPIRNVQEDLPENVREMGPSELAQALAAAGYKKGMLPQLDSLMNEALKYQRGTLPEIQRLERARLNPAPVDPRQQEAQSVIDLINQGRTDFSQPQQ